MGGIHEVWATFLMWGTLAEGTRTAKRQLANQDNWANDAPNLASMLVEDGVQFARPGRGADDGAGHVRGGGKGRGADDAPNHG